MTTVAFSTVRAEPRGRVFLSVVAAILAVWSGLIGAGPGAAVAVSLSMPGTSGVVMRQDAAASDLPACLLGHWTHSHEEDTLGFRVYRPADYPFPPARGRTGFAFLAGGDLTAYGIAPADGVLETRGRWTFTPPNLVGVTFDGGLAASETLAVVSCSSDLLTIATS